MEIKIKSAEIKYMDIGDASRNKKVEGIIELVKEYNYLGTAIMSRGNRESETNYKVSKAKVII